MSIQWIEHNGKKILHCDYRGLTIDESIIMFEQSMKEIAVRREAVLMISYFQGASLDYRFASRVYDIASSEQQGKASKIALVGIEGLKYVIREAFGILSSRKPSIFETEDEALKWLVN